jgi:hypothetical protein
MDRSRLLAAVYKRTGIVIGPDDPAFALVEINRLLVEEAVSLLVERLETLPGQIEASAKALAAEVAGQGVQRVVENLREARQTIAADSEGAQRRIAENVEKVGAAVARQVAAAIRAAQPSPRAGSIGKRWLLACAVIGLVSCSGGFVAGQLTTGNLLRESSGR